MHRWARCDKSHSKHGRASNHAKYVWVNACLCRWMPRNSSMPHLKERPRQWRCCNQPDRIICGCIWVLRVTSSKEWESEYHSDRAEYGCTVWLNGEIIHLHVWLRLIDYHPRRKLIVALLRIWEVRSQNFNRVRTASDRKITRESLQAFVCQKQGEMWSIHLLIHVGFAIQGRSLFLPCVSIHWHEKTWS